MVGHTHEDIDACFRWIMEEFMRLGFIGTIDEYLSAIKGSVKNRRATASTAAPEVRAGHLQP